MPPRQLPCIAKEMRPTAMLIDLPVRRALEGPSVILRSLRIPAQFHPRQPAAEEDVARRLSTVAQVLVKCLLGLLVAPEREQRPGTDGQGQLPFGTELHGGVSRPR